MSSFSAGQTYYHCSQRRSTNPDDPQAIPVSQSEPSWHLSVAVEARGLIPEHVKPTPAGSGPLDEVRILAIITTDANDLVAEIHDRMPLISCAHRLCPLAQWRARPARLNATVPCRAHADVANLHAHQQPELVPSAVLPHADQLPASMIGPCPSATSPLWSVEELDVGRQRLSDRMA